MATTPDVDTSKPEYLNWVKAGLVLRELKTGIEGFLDGAMRRVHGDLLAAIQRHLGITALTCTSCDSEKLRKTRYTCPNGICTFIKQQVDITHAFGKANLNNTDVTLWLDPTKYWEIAKCFLANGYSDKHSAVDTDCAGLLSLLLNCLDLYTLMAEDLTQPGNVVSEVRDLRNEVMHSGSLNMATSDLKQLTQKCLAILHDSKSLQHETAAMTAAGVISMIEAGGLTVTLADQLMVLQEARQVARDALRLQTLEREVKTLKDTQSYIKGELVKQDSRLTTQESTLTTQDARLTTQEASLTTQEARLNTHGAELTTHQSALDAQEARLETQEARLETQQSRLETQESRLETQQSRLETQESRLETQQSRLETQESRLEAHKSRLEAHESVLETHGAKLETQEDKTLETQNQVRMIDSLVQKLETEQGHIEQRVRELELRVNPAKATTSDEDEFKRFQMEKVAKLLGTVVVSKWSRKIKIEDIYTPIRIREDLEKEMMEKGLIGSIQKNENRLIKSEDEIFMKKGLQQFDIYILGKAGIGKTLFLTKLLQSWCRVQKNLPTCKLDHILVKFDFVFHVALRYAGKCDTLRDMIYKQACYSVEQHIAVAKEVLQSGDKHCLILVDGLDEWAATASAVSSTFSQPGIPDRQGLGRNCTILTTSRPWRVEALEKGLGHDCRVLEIEGLDKDGVLELSERLLGALKDPDHVASAKVFYEEIKEIRMEELVKIPLMLANIVVSWHRSGHKLDKSLCMNYSGMFESLIQRALSSDSDRISQASGGQAHAAPPCFATRHYCLQLWSLLQKLSHLAFHSLFGQEKERALVFDKQDLVDQFGETDLEECLKFGILSQSEADLESVDRIVSISFLHKTLQEFLAALYMCNSSWDSCLKTFQDRCETVDDVLDFQLIIIFLSGLAPDRGSELCSYAVQLVNDDEGIQQYRKTVEECLLHTRSSARAPVSTVYMLQSMLLDCSREAGFINTDLSKQELSRMYVLPDISVDSMTSADTRDILYSHAKHNASYNRSIVLKDKICTPSLVIEAVKDMTHLQRLEVYSPPDQVVSYMELLCQSLPKLPQLQALGFMVPNGTASVPLGLVKTLLDSVSSITSLSLEGLEIDSDLLPAAVTSASPVECQFPVNLVSLRLTKVTMSSLLLPLFTTRSLRSVFIGIVTLSHTQIEVLCDCLKASPSLQRVELWFLSCRDCGDQCRYCLDLSAVEQLHILYLVGLPVTRLSLDPRELEWVDILHVSELETWGPVLMSLTQAPKLRVLWVRDCSLSPRDVSKLVNILPQLSQLELLRLEGINFGDQETVTTSNMAQLNKIDMSRVTMSASSWRQFLQNLPQDQLSVMLQKDCNVDEDTLAEIRSSPRYKIREAKYSIEIETVPEGARD